MLRRRWRRLLLLLLLLWMLLLQMLLLRRQQAATAAAAASSRLHTPMLGLLLLLMLDGCRLRRCPRRCRAAGTCRPEDCWQGHRALQMPLQGRLLHSSGGWGAPQGRCGWPSGLLRQRWLPRLFLLRLRLLLLLLLLWLCRALWYLEGTSPGCRRSSTYCCCCCCCCYRSWQRGACRARQHWPLLLPAGLWGRCCRRCCRSCRHSCSLALGWLPLGCAFCLAFGVLQLLLLLLWLLLLLLAALHLLPGAALRQCLLLITICAKKVVHTRSIQRRQHGARRTHTSSRCSSRAAVLLLEATLRRGPAL